VRLHEKGGKQHEMPAHHQLEQYLDAYVTAAGVAGQRNVPLFRTLGGRGRKLLTDDRMTRQDARRMIVTPSQNCGTPDAHWLPQLPRYRDHRLFAQRRPPRVRPADGRA
jgi:hypothetical protein